MSLLRSVVCCSVLSFVLAGCGGPDFTPSKIGTVKGKLTINGQPASGVDVTFEPDMAPNQGSKVGTASSGKTDAGGMYELNYLGEPGKKGAVVGTHTVRLAETAGGGPAGGATGETAQYNIPAQYNTESTLKKEVKEGDNTIDIEITTK